MNTHANKTHINKSQSVANAVSQKQSGGESAFQFVDNRPEAILQRKLQEIANKCPQAMQLKALQEMANKNPLAKIAVQCQSMADNYSACHQQPIQTKENNTGLPDNLKSGIENLSGYSLNDAKVHYNSDKPSQFEAHAYARGTDIHLASGQKKHLPHEAWHVVQQKQGRVKPTIQMQQLDGGQAHQGNEVNDDPHLKREADVIGAKALQAKFQSKYSGSISNGDTINQAHLSINPLISIHQYRLNEKPILQRVLKVDNDPVKSFQDLENYVNTSTVRSQIEINLGSFISDLELNNAVRSVNLSINSGRDCLVRENNQTQVIKSLTNEILDNSKGRVEASSTLSTIITDGKVASAIHKQLGSKEVKRLSEVIRLMWDSRQFSVDMIIKILQEPEITHTYLMEFKTLLTLPRNNSLAMKMLSQKSASNIVDLLKEETKMDGFIKNVEKLRVTVEAHNIDPMRVIENEDEPRFHSEGNWLDNLIHDLKIITTDTDNNLKEDISYIADLESRYNHTTPEPDNPHSDYERLKAEIVRMKKIYTYKINYITIMKQWPAYFKDIENKLKSDIKAARLKIDQKIARLRKVQAAMTNFSPNATDGYRMKWERKSERLNQDIENQKQNLVKEIEQAKRKVKKEKDAFISKISKFLNIDRRYLRLIESNVMLLPGDMRLAGIFPKEKSVNIKLSKEGNTHEILHQHARKLILSHGLFQGTRYRKRKRSRKKTAKKGILPSSRTGCVCIMYIKEKDKAENGSTNYRPFFGASGIDPYEKDNQQSEKEKIDNSYVIMGLPKPSKTTVKYQNAVGCIREHVSSMKRLGIKPPSMQSKLYFLQTPEYQSNKIQKSTSDLDESLVSEAPENTIGLLENWMPSNCAEPAIMTAIYQLYHKSSDIFLSVPFEGELDNGKLLLKYTCTRCAVSEPAFMSPDSSDGGHHLTDMRIGKDMPIVSGNLEHEELVYNSQNKVHPYNAKTSAIYNTMWRNQREEFMHVKSGSEDSIQTIVTIMHMIDSMILKAIESIEKD